jgi:hypothetical protein
LEADTQSSAGFRAPQRRLLKSIRNILPAEAEAAYDAALQSTAMSA